MIPRHVTRLLEEIQKGYPVIAITGPRQSGKTTLAQTFVQQKTYVSFENPDIRERAATDPRGFLASHAQGAIFDEVQRCPEILSYLQQVVDENPSPGRFVLTGSQQFGLMSGITQSLAGRVATVELLPFSLSELYGRQAPPEATRPDLDSVMYRGLYPPVHDRNLDPQIWYANYIQTTVERDVRQLVNVRDLTAFQRFVRLCAGRIGQIVNFSELANDCGVTYNTTKAWLSILEASYIVFRLLPHFQNFNKRLIKTPKLYFYDTGLACWLLSVQSAAQLNVHAMRGHLFESWVISELLKDRFNRGLPSNLYFWQDRSKNEVDVLADRGDRLVPIEIKSGSTFHAEFVKHLDRWTALAGDTSTSGTVVYGGDESFTYQGTRVLPWHQAGEALS